MIVKFVATWFAPSDVVQRDKIQKISGRRFRAGVHDVPDELKEFLPKSATILKDVPEEPDQEGVVETLRDFDDVRKAQDEFQEKVEKAEEDAKKVKQERMANARAHIGKKKPAAKKEE